MRVLFLGLFVWFAPVYGDEPNGAEAALGWVEKLAELPVETPVSAELVSADYLIDGSRFGAAAFRSENGELVLSNGLIRRRWRLDPALACVGFDNLMTTESMLRAIRPEARLTIDGRPCVLGGLTGQPNQAFVRTDWLDEMKPEDGAWQFVGFELGEPEARFGWKRRRHASDGAKWPPAGLRLRFDFAPPANVAGKNAAADVLTGRKLLFQDAFDAAQAGWTSAVSQAHPRTSTENEGKPGEIYALSNTHAYLQRANPAEARVWQVTLSPGTDRSSHWGPGIGLAWKGRVVKLNVMSHSSHGDFHIYDSADGLDRDVSVQALTGAATYTLRLRVQDGKLICEARSPQKTWQTVAKLPWRAEDGAPEWVRIGKLGRHGANRDKDAPARGQLVRSKLQQFGMWTAQQADSNSLAGSDSGKLRVSVHYEMYDGIPVLSKWVTVHNGGQQPIVVQKFRAEELACVEHSNWVEYRQGVDVPRPDYLHVETDFAFGGFNHDNANRHAVHWRTDPSYTSQVNYAKQTPCLLVCEPTYGPEQRVQAGDSFATFRCFELVYDRGDRERRGLALRRMYRTVAPWVTENPLTHHLLSNKADKVRRAIDQAKEVGFEAVILSFGSGFNMENRDPEFLAQWREVAEHAEAQGIELGCYSLFSSRGVAKQDMIVSPAGQRPTHGRCPAVTSEWGRQWLKTIAGFYESTGFDQFENDGPYPGDVDTTERLPWQRGEADSRWVQWRLTAKLYQDLRAAGVYINAPDYYFLSGSNKCGMGYREVNWSLPREHQVIHTRQNNYDGTWTKTPSMGWMFVPLTQYHGGGAAATIEPLDQHRDHYQRMLRSNLGMGVQAHYRGPRLFDTDATRRMVRANVGWFKQYRAILESDVIHGRRADGRALDWVLHVNPQLETRGMLCVYNPTTEPIEQTLSVDLYYTGLDEVASISHEGREPERLPLGRNYRVPVKVTVPAGEMTWFVIR